MGTMFQQRYSRSIFLLLFTEMQKLIPNVFYLLLVYYKPEFFLVCVCFFSFSFSLPKCFKGEGPNFLHAWGATCAPLL